jgi:transposase-like protein/IS1 family transposase
MICCAHQESKKHGRDRYGNQRYRCLDCGKTWIEDTRVRPVKLLGDMTLPVEDAKRVLHSLVEGMSIRATQRTTGIDRNTICKLLVFFGDACRKFLDQRMRGLKLEHLQFDEQWTFVFKKQSRLTLPEREGLCDQGDVYLWTCIDQKTKLMPAFLVGKRSADNARRFMQDVAGRLVWPDTRPHASDAHAWKPGGYTAVTQISTDGFPAYPEAVDLAFGPYVKFGTIQKEYRNANMIYTPSEMVGTRRTGIKGIGDRQKRMICTSHVERLNGTQRLFLKRLNRLTYAFSKKLRNLEAAFALFACWYNYCWQTRKPGKSGMLRPTAAMMAGLAGHIWSFDELFDRVLRPATQ